MKQTGTPAIICLSHLSWDFVWQRPQQILSRLAEHYPLLYVNEPHLSPPDAAGLQVIEVAATATLTAWEVAIPDRKDELERWREVYWEMVRALLLDRGWVRESGEGLAALRPIILWFYTPVPYYMAGQIPASLVVYDVMDELSKFKGAPADMRERETRMLGLADLVFTGGRSLYEARRGSHPNLHLFPSGVEPAHFASANDPSTSLSPLLAGIPAPRLGYIGVVDERMDLELLDEVAAAQPGWSLVMVGPVRKIEEETLPRRPNIHYLGLQPYEDLPRLLQGFDVCLMPFAMNEATESISPTKTLEYMAARRPIVSTPVPDVVANWSDVVWIARGARPFVAAVREALAEGERARAARVRREQEHIRRSTWEAIAGSMRALIAAELQEVAV